MQQGKANVGIGPLAHRIQATRPKGPTASRADDGAQAGAHLVRGAIGEGKREHGGGIAPPLKRGGGARGEDEGLARADAGEHQGRARLADVLADRGAALLVRA